MSGLFPERREAYWRDGFVVVRGLFAPLGPGPRIEERVVVADDRVARGVAEFRRARAALTREHGGTQAVGAHGGSKPGRRPRAHPYAMTPEWMRPSLRGTHVVLGQRGVLVIDVVDPASRTLLWRGSVNGAVDPGASPAARDRRLSDPVGRVLAGFPPR